MVTYVLYVLNGGEKHKNDIRIQFRRRLLMKKEGFWAPILDKGENRMPWDNEYYEWPKESSATVDPDFIEGIGIAEQKAACTSYFGPSTCRICKKLNGNKEYTLGDWTWPEGYRHYIVDHNVQPTLEFEAFIREQK